MDNKMITFYHERSGESYSRWLDMNPHGYVANFGRSPSNTTIIHYSTCNSLTALGAATGEYGKHCFESESQMLAYAHYLDKQAYGCQQCGCNAVISELREAEREEQSLNASSTTRVRLSITID